MERERMNGKKSELLQKLYNLYIKYNNYLIQIIIRTGTIETYIKTSRD